MCMQKSLEMLPMPLATSHLERGSDWTPSRYLQPVKQRTQVFESVMLTIKTVKMEFTNELD
jgi:hypothetical protein